MHARNFSGQFRNPKFSFSSFVVQLVFGPRNMPVGYVRSPCISHLGSLHCVQIQFVSLTFSFCCFGVENSWIKLKVRHGCRKNCNVTLKLAFRGLSSSNFSKFFNLQNCNQGFLRTDCDPRYVSS